MTINASGYVKLFVGLAILVALFGSGVFFFSDDTRTTVELSDSGGDVFDSPTIGVESVSISAGLGDAVQLTGANDSEVATENPVDVEPPFSICSYARADSEVVSNDESRVIAGSNDLIIYYDGGADAFGVWWYNRSTRGSFTTTIPAPSPTTMTLVCGHHDGAEIHVSRNTTRSSSVAVSGSGISDVPSANWKGALEETRVFQSDLNNTQLSNYVADPALSVNDTTPAVRLMYDVWSRSSGDTTIGAYFHAGDAQLTNGSFVDGFSEPAVAEGADYRVSNDKERITLPPGGELGSGDVLFAEYDLQNDQPVRIIQLGIVIALLSVLLIPIMRRL